jgi:hypothetical protein
VRNPHRGALLGALAAWLGASSAAAAPDISADLRHCAAVESAAARLACYDALASRPAPSAATSTVPATAAPAAAAAALAVPNPAPVVSAPVQASPAAAPPAPAPKPMATTAAVPAPAPAPAPDPAEAARNFGLSSAQLHTAPQGPQSIEAHVTQVTQDQALRSFAVLDNGQTWLSTEGGFDLVTGELVTIKHAALGSYMLVSTTSKHSYHVRRVR